MTYYSAFQKDGFQNNAIQIKGPGGGGGGGFIVAWAINSNQMVGTKMKKNVAGQKIGIQMVSASDGSAFTGAVTAYVTGDAGTQAAGSVGSGACTHEGNGFHTYAPAQAETNYDHIGFTFTGTGAVPATVQLFTDFPQTGDGFARLGAPVGASISADIQTIDDFLDTEIAAILADTAEIGAAGAGLTAVPWNASWDSQVQSEVEDALVVYRLDELLAADSDIDGAAPPTVGSVFHELMTKTTGSFTYDQTTDSLEALRDRGDAEWITATGFSTHSASDVWAFGTRTLTAGTNINGSTFTAIPWNAAWDAEVQSEVQDAIEANHLDHLLAATYDPASKPGAADALLNELVESDSGVSRFTANALEQAPGGSLTAAAVADAVWEEAIADHSGTSGSTAEALAAAGSAGDPWITALPGAYSAGQAGYIIGNNINAPLDVIDTIVDAIKTKTDTLAFTAGRVNANIKAVNDVDITGIGIEGTDEWRPV